MTHNGVVFLLCDISVSTSERYDFNEIGWNQTTKLILLSSIFSGHQGTGVLSYFVFLKWLFFLNIYLFLLIFVFVVIPHAAFNSQGYTTAVTNAGVSVSTTNTITCSVLYSNNVTTSSAAADLIQDFIQGTVRFLLFERVAVFVIV